MPTSAAAWQIVPYEEASPFKKMRVRDDARVRAVVRHLMNDECVSLLGPPMSEKSHLLRDVAAALTGTGRFRPLYVDLWHTRSHDEAAFFTSLAELIVAALGERAAVVPASVPDPRSFQALLTNCANVTDVSIALLIDHLQALPHDLVHSLLLALRSAYMEREADAPHSLVAVVTGGLNLVGLSTGPTSPFNIAKPVVAVPLTTEQSVALTTTTLTALDCEATTRGLARIVDWAGGDRYLVPLLASRSAEAVRDYRFHRVTYSVVERAAQALLNSREDLAPVRAAIRMIEEDPDTLLDVLHLLDHGGLARSRSRQMPTRTGTDRLQLCGAVALVDGCYTFVNRIYRDALAAHLAEDRVGHILRIAGRWGEAIQYLAPRLAPVEPADAPPQAAERRPSDSFPRMSHPARPQLLEAIVQSIYATDSPVRGYALLADGLRLGFDLSEIAIYCARLAEGRLDLVYPEEANHSAASIDLRDPACVEAQTFYLGNYALRGSADEARLVVALHTGGRSIGVVTVEHYVQKRDPHQLPEHLPDLLHYLQHAAGAMENAIIRAAYRAIGQAVLDAKAMQPTMERVLATVAEALGCDYSILYLADDTHRSLEMVAGVGRVVTGGRAAEEWQSLAHFSLSGTHPAATALVDGRVVTARGSDEGQDKTLVERFGLHRYARVFVPLRAAGEQLGTLELGYGGGRTRTSEEQKRTLGSFADQVAIAVHNMLLLRRTDEALTRKMAEISVGREIQLSLLPKTLPVVPGWEFAAVYQAARTVGGDFYDFCDLPGSPPRLGIVIADVADKGVPAALFMALSRTIIRSVALSGRGPSAVLTRANQLILGDSQAELFLTAIYTIIETSTGRIMYCNAGHNRPMIYRAKTGTLSELTQRGIILGAFEEITLHDDRLDLDAGDVLLLYTDGITDALNAEGEDFGEQRLQQVVAAHARGSAEEILWAITGALSGFIGETEQADDVTSVVVKRVNREAPSPPG
jgi:serine phosphatase RsbU (regulator of sigma subunit)